MHCLVFTCHMCCSKSQSLNLADQMKPMNELSSSRPPHTATNVLKYNGTVNYSWPRLHVFCDICELLCAIKASQYDKSNSFTNKLNFEREAQKRESC